MKASIYFCIFIICLCSRTSAQTNYYAETKTFHEDGYTYQCDVNKASVASLYNAECHYYKTEQIDLRTGEKYKFLPGLQPLEKENQTKPQCFAIVNRAFPPEIKTKIKHIELCIALYINPATGQIADVVFRFPTLTSIAPYTLVPISVYREIEIELKKSVRFTPSAEGKNLNYISMFWRQDPNVTIKNALPAPPELEIMPDDDEYRRK